MLLSSRKWLLNRCLRPPMCRAFGRYSYEIEEQYKILGVKSSSSMDEVKTAYRDLCKKYHPDVCKEGDSEDRFKKISNAYQTLKAHHKQGNFGANKATTTRKDYEHRSNTTYRYADNRTYKDPTGSSQSGTENKDEYDEAWREWQRGLGKEEEEILYEQIFRRPFKEDPAFYYRKENQHLRRQYEEELAKIRVAKGAKKEDARKSPFPDKDPDEEAFWREFAKEHNHYTAGDSGMSGTRSMSYQEGFSVSANVIKAMSAGLVVLAGVIGYMLFHERNRATTRFEKSPNLTAEELDKVRNNYMKREEGKREQRKLEFQESLALMKKYPRRNPNAISMLVDYSIWNDIKLYSIPWNYFHGADEDLTVKSNNFVKNRLHNIKLNAMMTLSLESERVLKNVFVKVDDVLKSLNETGHFEPPGIFFRYYGYIFLKLRKKPIIAENLKECIDNKEKVISVFDLFFRYSTPILMANNEYYEIPLKHHAFIPDTTTREGIGWVGSAHVNYRPLDKRIYNPDEKNIFMWKGPSDTTAAHQRYLRTWGEHYPVFEKMP